MKLDLSLVPKNLKPNPIFKGMPKTLKDPKCFKSVEKKLSKVLKTDHKHKTASSYVKCEECNLNREERKRLMKEIGFKSYEQYLQWKKIMVIISKKENFELI